MSNGDHPMGGDHIAGGWRIRSFWDSTLSASDPRARKMKFQRRDDMCKPEI